MPAVIRRMRERIDKEASPQEARELWVSTLVLLGLRYEPEYASELLKGVRQMQESSTYRAILAEGIAEGRAVGVAEGKAEGKAEGILAGQFTEARRILTMLGRKRLGEPTPEVRDALAAISTAEQFEELTLRITDVETWGELLATVG
jgi:predicted transposase YdaD